MESEVKVEVDVKVEQIEVIENGEDEIEVTEQDKRIRTKSETAERCLVCLSQQPRYRCPACNTRV